MSEIPASSHFSSDDLRSGWTLTVASAIQVVVGRIVLDPTDLPPLESFIRTIPPPPDDRDLGLLDRWVRRLRASYTEALARSSAAKAARHIECHYTAALQPVPLARAVGCSVSSLRRHFHDEFGTTLRDFHARIRICEGFRLIATGETVSKAAERVGYRTEKDFYRAARRVAGVKPRSVRGLSSEDLMGLLHHVRPAVNLRH